MVSSLTTVLLVFAGVTACAPRAAESAPLRSPDPWPEEAPPSEMCARHNLARASLAICSTGSAQVFSLRNESNFAAGLLSRVDVQMRPGDGDWNTTAAFFYLDANCRRQPPSKRCVVLGPGETLQPRAWSGFSCSGQCRRNCDGNHYMRGWPLRYVLWSCDGQHHIGSPPFRLQEYQDEPAQAGGSR